MYTTGIIIIIFVILCILFGTIAVQVIGINRQHENEYQEYINSINIKIGDTFADNRFTVYSVDVPLHKNFDNLGFNIDYYTTVLGIEKNNKGETLVKYCFTNYVNTPNHCVWYDEITEFVKHRALIWRRIDNGNINTIDEQTIDEQ